MADVNRVVNLQHEDSDESGVGHNSEGQVTFEEHIDLKEIDLEGVKPKRTPRKILHFVDGSTLEEYSTDEEEEGESAPQVDPKTLDWFRWFWFWLVFVATKTLNGADFLGEKFAWGLGITSPKYQAEIDEYYRTVKEDEEDRKKDEEEAQAELQEVTSHVTNEQETDATDSQEVGFAPSHNTVDTP